MATAKVFKHGNSQAVRLPKEFRVEGDEVEVSRVGRVIVLRPKKTSYEDVVAAFSRFRGGISRDRIETGTGLEGQEEVIWLLDTNVVIHLCNHAPGHDRIFRRMSGRSPGELRISAVTMCELEFGIENGSHREQNRAALDDILGVLEVDALPAAAARHYAEIKHALAKKGRPTKPYDLLIGAHARAIGATLVTSDTGDFRAMPGLGLANWLQP